MLVSGGVAANRELRVRFTAEAADRDLTYRLSRRLALSTDNAAMIAAAAWPKFLSRRPGLSPAISRARICALVASRAR